MSIDDFVTPAWIVQFYSNSLVSNCHYKESNVKSNNLRFSYVFFSRASNLCIAREGRVRLLLEHIESLENPTVPLNFAV